MKRNMDGRLRNKLWVPPVFRESEKPEKERAVEEGGTKRKQCDQHTAKLYLEPHVHSGNYVNLTVFDIYNQLLEYFGYGC